MNKAKFEEFEKEIDKVLKFPFKEKCFIDRERCYLLLGKYCPINCNNKRVYYEKNKTDIL